MQRGDGGLQRVQEARDTLRFISEHIDSKVF